MTNRSPKASTAGDAQTVDSASSAQSRDTQTTSQGHGSSRRRILLGTLGVPTGLGAAIGAVDAAFSGGGQGPSPDQILLREQAAAQDLSPQKLTITPAIASSLDVQPGDQVRVTTDAGVTALYTIADLVHESPRTIARASSRGRARLSLEARSTHDQLSCPEPGTVDLPNSIDVSLDDTVVDTHLDASEAERQNEFIEAFDTGHGPLAIAPHGGDIQPRTALQATALSKLCNWSSYRVHGYSESSAFVQWYVPSQQYSPRSFPVLDGLDDHPFEHVISFNGICPSRIVVGGAAKQSLREHVRDTINHVLPECATTAELATDTYDATGDRTLVNRLSADGGIWIGQGRQEREAYAAGISFAVGLAFASISSGADPDEDSFGALGDGNSLC